MNNNNPDSGDEFTGVFEGIEQEIAESGLLAQLDKYRGDSYSQGATEQEAIEHSEIVNASSDTSSHAYDGVDSVEVKEEESNVSVVTRTDYRDYLPSFTVARHQNEQLDNEATAKPKPTKKWNFAWVTAGAIAFLNFSFYFPFVALIGIVLLVILNIKKEKHTVGNVIATSLMAIAFTFQLLMSAFWINPIF